MLHASNAISAHPSPRAHAFTPDRPELGIARKQNDKTAPCSERRTSESRRIGHDWGPHPAVQPVPEFQEWTLDTPVETSSQNESRHESRQDDSKGRQPQGRSKHISYDMEGYLMT